MSVTFRLDRTDWPTERKLHWRRHDRLRTKKYSCGASPTTKPSDRWAVALCNTMSLWCRGVLCVKNLLCYVDVRIAWPSTVARWLGYSPAVNSILSFDAQANSHLNRLSIVTDCIRNVRAVTLRKLFVSSFRQLCKNRQCVAIIRCLYLVRIIVIIK